MKTSRIVTLGILLAVGMFLYSGIAVGAFRHSFFVASIVWIPILILLGYVIRRRWLPSSNHAVASVGLGFLFFSLILLGLCALESKAGIMESLWNTGQMITSIYGIWFWLPFSSGVAFGGFRRNGEAEQAAS